MIYLDNASTSFPKPPQVYDAADAFMRTVGASAGRSAHRLSVEASRIVFAVRDRLASLFNIADASRIIFTLNATEALNLAILGIVKEGERVVVSSLEHNSVMRPVRHLVKSRNVNLDIVPCGPQGEFDLEQWEAALRRQPRPSLVIVNHGSNVIGTVAPVEALGALCRKYGARFLVDAAQTAGVESIDVEHDRIDLLAFCGHKGLYGVQGTGGLYIREGCDPIPHTFGGTGSNSESDEQPLFLPDRYESGTLNVPGIASLGAGVAFVMERGIEAICDHNRRLIAALFDGLLLRIPGIRIHGP